MTVQTTAEPYGGITEAMLAIGEALREAGEKARALFESLTRSLSSVLPETDEDLALAAFIADGGDPWGIWELEEAFLGETLD